MVTFMPEGFDPDKPNADLVTEGATETPAPEPAPAPLFSKWAEAVAPEINKYGQPVQVPFDSNAPSSAFVGTASGEVKANGLGKFVVNAGVGLAANMKNPPLSKLPNGDLGPAYIKSSVDGHTYFVKRAGTGGDLIVRRENTSIQIAFPPTTHPFDAVNEAAELIKSGKYQNAPKKNYAPNPTYGAEKIYSAAQFDAKAVAEDLSKQYVDSFFDGSTPGVGWSSDGGKPLDSSKLTLSEQVADQLKSSKVHPTQWGHSGPMIPPPGAASAISLPTSGEMHVLLQQYHQLIQLQHMVKPAPAPAADPEWHTDEATIEDHENVAQVLEFLADRIRTARPKSLGVAQLVNGFTEQEGIITGQPAIDQMVMAVWARREVRLHIRFDG